MREDFPLANVDEELAAPLEHSGTRHCAEPRTVDGANIDERTTSCDNTTESNESLAWLSALYEWSLLQVRKKQLE